MRARLLIFLFTSNILCPAIFGQSFSKTEVTINKNTGEYSILTAPFHWSFKGSIGHSLTDLQNNTGHDSIGTFNQTSFSWMDTIAYKASIKWYNNSPVILFSITLPQGSSSAPIAFPSFTSFPASMHTYSFYDDNFAPPQFKLNETSTPWLFFNNSMNAYILSPASDFIVSKMMGDGKNVISSGLNFEIKNLPANFTHTTLLVTGQGIQHTWDEWGNALRKLYNRRRPANDADPVLKYFGYWTDNGADYYYNYDTTKGYSPTLLELRKKYKEEGIPLGYMQLDSWWYEKSIYDYNGKPDADHKNKNLPSGRWNRYGGLLSYTADSFLFPHGLNAFDEELKLPLVTHNRWVDPRSPYHDKYNISGFAAVDPEFWATIIGSIHKEGVVCYEQDWLNYIYSRSPQMASDITIGNAFTDGMAAACKNNGLDMQYCMAMPRHFLQGVKYNNLTTIRTSEDRFNPENWRQFLYVSQLAYEIGSWPWCDVFKSDEMGNMILSVLSAGPVGTGDAIGKENKENILKACRTDGVLVKPDVPILPLDINYLNDAEGKDAPLLNYTYTKHNEIKTYYVFAFTNSKEENRNINFKPSALGMKGKLVVFDPLTKKIKTINATDNFNNQLGDDLYTYYILAPVTSSGIAFLGDAGKIVATGKKRISEINDANGSLQITVLFAKGEPAVTLQGYAEKPVETDKGNIHFDPSTHLFTLILPSDNYQKVTVHLKCRH
jgi:hypothetical protein